MANLPSMVREDLSEEETVKLTLEFQKRITHQL